MEDILSCIAGTIRQFNIDPFVFVDQHQFKPDEEKQMMQQAMKDIEDCDILIAETSYKAIGIGIEAGYAKAKGKPVIYLRHKDAEHSTTVSGISDYQIIYTDTNDLKSKLKTICSQILHKS